MDYAGSIPVGGPIAMQHVRIAQSFGGERSVEAREVASSNLAADTMPVTGISGSETFRHTGSNLR